MITRIERGISFVEEAIMFFQGKDPVHQTLSRLVESLEKSGIPYAIMGAMAVNAHGHKRMTDDVDVLLTSDGLAKFRRLFVSKEYETVPKRPRRFLDKATGVTFDVLVTGLFPGNGKPGPIRFPAPEAVSVVIEGHHVVNLANLVQLKLAARRHKDFGDVVSMIQVHNLDESFLDKLHPSLHRDFVECLEEKRREETYEAEQDRIFEEMYPAKDYDDHGSEGSIQ